MNNEEKILEMLAAMQGSISAIQTKQEETDQKITAIQAKQEEADQKITAMQAKLDDLVESHDEVRTCINALLEWTEIGRAHV